MWFCGVFCTLIDNDIRHHSGQNVVDSLGAADCDISSIRIDNAELTFDVCYDNSSRKENIYFRA